MNIAIVYICTGRYNQFFEGFYNSSEKYFLKNIANKQYFVFTDNSKISVDNNVTIIEKKCEGFPLDSIMRFNMFLSISEELKKYDYIYFFNSNMLFVSHIGPEILPNKDGEIVFALNGGYYNKTPLRYPFERNQLSKAFIPFKLRNKYRYVIGGLNGGKTKDYLLFCQVCYNNIMEDYKNGIMAIYHDESHINRYFYDYGGKLLPSSYACPEDAKTPYKPLIIIRNKVKIDIYFDKVIDHSKKTRVFKGFKIVYSGIRWLFLN
ncbi:MULTISPECIES: family 6 glucosyltransferase [unclassified Flavobacterium]|uniref:family 6 glucosyltransferase n=1 Tax=unclassified Flavobacterium TaxID=196869 RepID=UPI00131C3518|nr:MULTISPECIES: family 6 glucosyltransferase [unclassified Flavobacterium]